MDHPLLPLDASSFHPWENVDWGEVRFISLLRRPASAAALSFTDQVASHIEPNLARARPLGPAGRKTQRQQVGAILGGLLKAAFRGLPVRAQRGKSDTSWWKGAAIGFDAFWAQVGAMEAGGLITSQQGTSYKHGGHWSGRATALFATKALLAMAAAHDLSKANFAEDWPLTEKAQRERPTVAADEVVQCFEIPTGPSDARRACPFEPLQGPQVAAKRAQVERLNEHLSQAVFTGCQPPVLTRRFFRDVRLGGRFYAAGAETFQIIPRAARPLLGINGAPVVEVDLRAAALSIVLALRGAAIPADPYSVGLLARLDRATVKAWITQCLNSGKVPGKWSEKHTETVRQTALKTVTKAVLAVYPHLAETATLLPPDLNPLIPLGREGWVVGQWLTGIEAEIMERALGRLMERGVVALPLHDALLVPKDASEAAQEALQGAFVEVLGVEPQVRMKGYFDQLDPR